MGKREAILQATIDTIAEHGIAGSPTAMIAKQAGAAELTLFRIFGNKQELLHQAYDEVTKRFHDECSPEVEDLKDAEQKLIAVYQASLKHFRKYPNELSYLRQYFNSVEGQHRRPDYLYEQGKDISPYPLVAVLHEGKTQGVFKNLPMTTLLSLAGVTIIMLLGEEQLRKIKHTDETVDQVIQAILQAIKT